jgi:nitroreductase
VYSGEPARTVSEAVATRRSIRAFLPEAPPPGEVERLLRLAARAPSGGNLQPSFVHVLEGARLDTLKALMARRCAEDPEGEPMSYSFYPERLPDAYWQRRVRNGEILYGALGIDRKDKAARLAWIHENFQFFGAPMGLLFFMEKGFGQSQWMDLGIYLQTVMLLLREAGLDSCPQADWALFERTVCEHLGVPGNLTLICGMCVGYRDPAAPINIATTERDDPVLILGGNPGPDQ